jgi:hypothetical protein
MKPRKVRMMICLPKGVMALVKKARKKDFNLSKFVEEGWFKPSGTSHQPGCGPMRVGKNVVRTTINVSVGMKEDVGELHMLMPFNFSAWIAEELREHFKNGPK